MLPPVPPAMQVQSVPTPAKPVGEALPYRPLVAPDDLAERKPVPLDALRKAGELEHLGPHQSPRLVPLAPFNPEGPVTVFIHGILADPANQEVLIREAQARGQQVWVMAYETIGHGASENSEGFARELARLGESGARNVKIVAHSLGALTSKAALDRLTRPDGRLAAFDHVTYVTLGAPWGGISAADLALLFPASMQSLNFAKDLAPDGAFWSKTAHTPLSSQVDFYSLSGSLDQFRLIAVGSKAVGENREAILSQARRVVVLPGNMHNTVLWNPATADFVRAPEGERPPANPKPGFWHTVWRELAASLNLPGAFKSDAPA